MFGFFAFFSQLVRPYSNRRNRPQRGPATRALTRQFERLEERATPATFFGALAGSLALDLNTSHSSLAIDTTATQYTLTLTGDTWTSPNIAGGATGSGSSVLTITKNAFTDLNLGDSAPGVAVNFSPHPTLGHNFTDSVAIALDDPTASTVNIGGKYRN